MKAYYYLAELIVMAVLGVSLLIALKKNKNRAQKKIEIPEDEATGVNEDALKRFLEAKKQKT